METVYDFAGTDRKKAEFRHLDRELHLCAEKVFRERGTSPFLVVCASAGRTEKSYADFERDLRERAASILGCVQESTEVAICVGGNTYANLLNIVASLLLGYSVMPLSVAEPAARIRKRVSSLNRKKVVFADRPADGVGVVPVSDGSRFEGPWRGLKNSGEMFFLPSSGSTGEPKVVRQSESAVLANCDALLGHHDMVHRPWIATPLPIFHVNALEFSFLCSFLSGSRLTLLESFQLPTLLDELESTAITVLSLTPSVIRGLLGFADRVSWDRTALRYVVSAAAPLSADLAESWFRKTGIPIVQGYGLSEAVNFSATMPIDLDPATYEKVTFRSEFPSIGVELRGNELLVLDDSDMPLGPLARGEIAVRGWNVMTGYHGEPELETLGRSSFRTGDLGYFSVEGGRRFFFISGRKKDMIKKSGHSISLREVDDALARFLGDRGDAISVPHPDWRYGENFGVLVNPRSIPESEVTALGDLLVESFGEACRPSAVLRTEERLRTPSGKPQRFRFSGLFETQKRPVQNR